MKVQYRHKVCDRRCDRCRRRAVPRDAGSRILWGIADIEAARRRKEWAVGRQGKACAARASALRWPSQAPWEWAPSSAGGMWAPCRRTGCLRWHYRREGVPEVDFEQHWQLHLGGATAWKFVNIQINTIDTNN